MVDKNRQNWRFQQQLLFVGNADFPGVAALFYMWVCAAFVIFAFQRSNDCFV